MTKHFHFLSKAISCGCIVAYAGGAALALAATLGSANAQRADGPFDGLAGRWSGGGTIMLAGGGAERIRCRATYSVHAGGEAMSQNLRCASPSYQLVVSSQIVARGSAISGSWSEASRGVSGSVSGRAMGPNIEAHVAGGSFAANIRIRTHGGSQSVGITPQAGTDVATVSITLHKG